MARFSDVQTRLDLYCLCTLATLPQPKMQYLGRSITMPADRVSLFIVMNATIDKILTKYPEQYKVPGNEWKSARLGGREQFFLQLKILPTPCHR